MLRSEAEIKEFIDSRKVLSKIELSRFIYGYKNANKKTERWWLYVLQTKNLEKLYKEKQKRINTSSLHKDKERILVLFETDERLKNAGARNRVKYLKQFYNISVERSTLQKWSKQNAKIN